MTAIRPMQPGMPGPPMQVFSAYGPYAWLLPEELWVKPKRFYVYTTSFVGVGADIPANGSRTRTIAINRDSVFALISVSGTVTDTTDATTVDAPALLVQVVDAGSGLELTQEPVHWLDFFGRASAGDAHYRYLELPRLVDPGSTIRITISNLTATARHARIAFHGFRIYGV